MPTDIYSSLRRAYRGVQRIGAITLGGFCRSIRAPAGVGFLECHGHLLECHGRPLECLFPDWLTDFVQSRAEPANFAAQFAE
jgi:hypothetical protein